MGGGKALVNAYYRSAEALGVQVATTRAGGALELEGGRFVAAHTASAGESASASRRAPACWPAGGFESNRDWLREAWGQTNAASGRPTTS
jgi:tricarballylate dehydrogenase